MIENKIIPQPVSRFPVHLSYEAVIRKKNYGSLIEVGHWKIEVNFHVSKLKYFFLNINYFPNNDIETLKKSKKYKEKY